MRAASHGVWFPCRAGGAAAPENRPVIGRNALVWVRAQGFKRIKRTGNRVALSAVSIFTGLVAGLIVGLGGSRVALAQEAACAGAASYAPWAVALTVLVVAVWLALGYRRQARAAVAADESLRLAREQAPDKTLSALITLAS